MRIVSRFLILLSICVTAHTQELPGQLFFFGEAGVDYAQFPALPGSLSGSMQVEGEIDTTTFLPETLEGTAAILMNSDSTSGQTLLHFAIEPNEDETYNLFAMYYTSEEPIEVGEVGSVAGAYFLFAYHMDSLAIPDFQSDSLDIMDMLDLISAQYRIGGTLTSLEFVAVEEDALAWEFEAFGLEVNNPLMMVNFQNGYASVEGIPLDVGPTPATLPRSTCITANPNPFNPSTSITITTPQTGRYSLAVYNILGYRQEALELEHLPAGQSTVRLQADSWPGGVYFLSLEQGGISVATQKVTLMK